MKLTSRLILCQRGGSSLTVYLTPL